MTAEVILQTYIDKIEDPSEQYPLKIQRGDIVQSTFLEEVKEICVENELSEEDTNFIIDEVNKRLWGFGVIDDLINKDDDISDIRLIDENTIRIKKRGKRMSADVHFRSRDDYLRFIEGITTRNNTNTAVINAAQVFTDNTSSENCILRFSLVSDLINTNNVTSLLIRKILKKKKDFDRLMNKDHYLSQAQLDYIKKRWDEGHGILVCGPNGSGKTTLTNAILDITSLRKSAVVIQESEELFCNVHPEMMFRKVIPGRSNSSISYNISDLCRLALMESFDVIVVGEVKGKEASQIAYATYTGSQCMTTVHSISAKDGVSKMIDYAMEDEEKKMTAEQYAKQFQALDTVIYVSDYHISEIEELTYNPENPNYYDFNTLYLDHLEWDEEGNSTKIIDIDRLSEPTENEGDTDNKKGKRG